MTRWSAVLCAVLLMISLFAIPVFAAEESTAATVAATESASEPATESAPASEAESETASEAESETASESTASSGDNSSSNKKDEGLSITAIIWIAVGAIVLIVAVVLAIKFRANIAKGLRVYKSEFKKVSWLSWEQTRKSTFVVVVILVVFALVIGLIDMGLFEGFHLALDGFKALFN